MNYTELKAEITDWSHRSDLTSKYDTFCELAESSINEDLRCIEMEKRLEPTFDDAFYDLPTDYIAMRALHIVNGGARVPIQQVTPQILDARYSNATGVAGGFAIHGGQVELRPAPSVSSTLEGEITYYARVPTLVSNSTNDILTNYPLIYLSGMLVQVYLYLQDNDELAKWVQVYNTQIKTANKAGQSGRYVNPQVQI